MDRMESDGEPAVQPASSAPPNADPADLAQIYAAALQSHKENRGAEAQDLYRRVLELDPNHVGALHMLGVLAYQSGRADVAVDLIGRAIAAGGENATCHNNLGEALRYLGRVDEAATHFARAIELDPDAPEGHMNLGNALRLQGRLEQAIDRYRRALDLNPDYAEAHMNLGAALMAQGKPAEAADHYRRSLSLNPNFPEALMNLGIVTQQRGDFEEAVTLYRKAIALRPQYAAAHFNLGNALLERGTIGEALARFQYSLCITAGAPPPSGPLAPLASVQQAVNRKRALFPLEEPGFMNLVRANCWRSPTRYWRTLCTAALEQTGLSQASRLELFVRVGISQWLEGDRGALTDTLRAAGEASEAIGPSPSRELRNSRAYANFLGNLLRYEEVPVEANGPGLPELAVIGDSHCLAFHGRTVAFEGTSYRTSGHLVMGCKSWHLASPDSNLYKWRLSGLLDTIPEDSPIICCFGEIDCRLDEGILPYHRRAGGDLEQLIADQTRRYVAYVEVAATPRRLKPIFVGVPAPHFDALAADHPDASVQDKALLLDIIKAFNMALRRAATDHGHRFIDVFALSAAPEGTPTGSQHLDDYHLKPDALALALQL